MMNNFFMIICTIFILGEVITPSYGQEYKKQNIINISTASELLTFRQQVNEGRNMKNKIIILTNDIFLNDTADWQNWDVKAAGKKQWIPIGTCEKPFCGFFDGQGYTIYGLYINRSKDGFYQGLFGVVYDSTIKNISLKASVIKGYQFIGGIIGHVGIVCNSENSTNIENCSNFSKIIGSRNFVGGIIGAGKVQFNALLSITNCSNYGKVCGINQIGGIIGACDNGYIRKNMRQPSLLIYNCANRGSISGTTEVGGICGWFNNKVISAGGVADTIANCYNTGKIQARMYGGGIVGRLAVCKLRMEDTFSLSFSNCYNAGKVKCEYIASADDLVGVYRDLNNFSNLPLIEKCSSPCYFLENKEQEVGRRVVNYTSSPKNVVKLTEEEMRSPDFVEKLNMYSSKSLGRHTGWRLDSLQVNNGYPIFIK